ncbi:MAG: prevent-host-death protein [Nitrospira sp.]|nr:prevent-host-death protein [Nitrospira sp.]
MGKTISATEAVRQFSDLLNRIWFRGERYTIARGGKPIATLAPVSRPATCTLGELIDRLKKLPRLDDDAKMFAQDVRRGIRKALGPPKKSSRA